MNKEKINLLISIFVQFSNYIFPLIFLIYISHTVKSDELVLFLFTQTFIQFFISLTDYGFVITGTKFFSLKSLSSDKDDLSIYFTNVIFIKIILFLISLAILFFATFISTYIQKNIEFILYFFGVIFGNLLFPGWAYIGLKKFHFIYLNTILVYLILGICLFIFPVETNINLIALSYSISYIIPSLIGFIFMIYQVGLKRPSIKKILYLLKDAKNIFFSNTIINYYHNIPLMLLGLNSVTTQINQYSVPDKLLKISINFMNFIVRMTLPYAISSNAKITKNILNLSFIVSTLILILIYFKNEILLLVFNNNDIETFTYNLMMFTLLFKVINIYFVNHYFYIFNLENIVLKVYSTALILEIIFIYLFIHLNMNIVLITFFFELFIFIYLLNLYGNRNK